MTLIFRLNELKKQVCCNDCVLSISPCTSALPLAVRPTQLNYSQCHFRELKPEWNKMLHLPLTRNAPVALQNWPISCQPHLSEGRCNWSRFSLIMFASTVFIQAVMSFRHRNGCPTYCNRTEERVHATWKPAIVSPGLRKIGHLYPVLQECVLCLWHESDIS